MVPASYLTYFAAVTGAAAALIGLLFVSVTLRPGTVFGPEAPARGRAMAASSFTGLVNAFFVSLSALVPGTNIGYPAVVVAALGLMATVRLQLQIASAGSQLLFTLLTVCAFGFQVVAGVLLVVAPRRLGLVQGLAYVLIAGLAAALARAWLLLQGRHVAPRAHAPATASPASVKRGRSKAT